MTLKDELRLVGAPYATREEWRNNSRKDDEMEPKQKKKKKMLHISKGFVFRIYYELRIQVNRDKTKCNTGLDYLLDSMQIKLINPKGNQP